MIKCSYVSQLMLYSLQFHILIILAYHVFISVFRYILAQIFCSTRLQVEDFVLDVQQKFSTRRLIAEKQLPTRRLLEGVNFYQMSSSRKIALLDIQQNFYWMPSRTFTRRLVDQMIWANVNLLNVIDKELSKLGLWVPNRKNYFEICTF